MNGILKEKVFPEPRLIIFTREETIKDAQGMIIVENEVLLDIEKFDVLAGLISLIATYYIFDVSYPKLAAATNFLLFLQEVLMGKPNTDKTVKRTAAYRALTNFMLD